MYLFSQICFPNDNDKYLIGFRVTKEGIQKYQEDNQELQLTSSALPCGFSTWNKVTILPTPSAN